MTGTFQDDVDQVTVGLSAESPLNVTVTIKDINQPIEDSVDLGLQLEEKNLVKVKVEGTVSAIQNNLVDIDHLAANQTIELSDGDLAAVSQVLHAYASESGRDGENERQNHRDHQHAGQYFGGCGDRFRPICRRSGKQLAGDTVAI